MKYMLIGLGSLVVVSALVWMGTQNYSTVDQALVDKDPEATVEANVPKLDIPSIAVAHGSGVDAMDHAVTISDGPAVDVVSAVPMDELMKDVSEKAVSSSDCEDSGEGSCDQLQASPDEPAVDRSTDHMNKKEHGKPKKTLVVGVPTEPSFVTVKTGDQPPIETGRDESITPEMVAAAHEDSLNAEQFADKSILKGVSEPMVEDSVEGPIVQNEAPAEELVVEELLALPTSPNPMAEEVQDNRVKNPITLSSKAEPGSAEPQMMAQSEPGDERMTSDKQQEISRASGEDDRGYRLEVIGIQGGFNAKYVAIPPTEKEDFEHIAIFGAMSFPKRYTYDSGWEIRFRMNGSAGVLHSSGDLGFIATLVPGIVFWYPEWNISINGGPGLAYVSREKYGDQDLGGPIQIVGQGGLTYYVTDHIGIGWRFHHISDAGMWGSDNRGVDVNLFELTYKF